MASAAARFRAGDYKRPCDICGRGDLYRSQLVRKGEFLVCPDDRKGRSRRALDRATMQAEPRKIRRARDAKPDTEVRIYQAEEGELFNVLFARVGPDTQATYAGEEWFTLGETVRYFWGVVNENTRPGRWIAQAKTRMRAIGDLILKRQYGDASAAAGYAAASTVAWYGGVTAANWGFGNVGGIYTGRQAGNAPGTDSTPGAYVNAADVASVGLALIYCYDKLGDTKYREGARNAATCLRRLQCGDLLTANFAASNAAKTSPWHSGMFAATMKIVAGTAHFGHNYLPEALGLGLDFLSELKRIDGDRTYGDDTAVGQFTARTDATVSTMISEAKAFWETGAREDSTLSDYKGQVIKGLSAATPRNYFAAYGSNTSHFSSSDQGKWRYQTAGQQYTTVEHRIEAVPFCIALRGLYNEGGYSARVQEVYEWLRGLTSNPVMDGTVLYDPTDATNVLVTELEMGVFDPSLAISFRVAIPLDIASDGALYVNRNATGSGGFYDWMTAGLLAKIQSDRDRAKFETMRLLVSESIPFVEQRNSEPNWFGRTHEYADLTIDLRRLRRSWLEAGVYQTGDILTSAGLSTTYATLLNPQCAAVMAQMYRLAPLARAFKDEAF